ncbi:alpha/beta hydrolase fold domain-containing protein, partial [Nocardia brevicatena]|uniref:alpha/beta hydrolase fold domain-containing protein n=1 Tax=Nocardia brevicatena TaxID=37327 RepID=UPI001FDFBF34
PLRLPAGEHRGLRSRDSRAEIFNAFYIGSGAGPADPLVSPVKRADLSGLPPALIITAEYDPMCDEGEFYGRLLGEAGVEVTVGRYAGANHDFVQNFSRIPGDHGVFAETADFLDRRGFDRK